MKLYEIKVFEGRKKIIHRFYNDYDEALDDLDAIENRYKSDYKIEFTNSSFNSRLNLGKYL